MERGGSYTSCARPIGFFGSPDSRGSRSSAHDSSGGFQSGFQTTWVMFHSPVLVGHSAEPTATGCEAVLWPPFSTCSWRALMSTSIRMSAVTGVGATGVVGASPALSVESATVSAPGPDSDCTQPRVRRAPAAAVRTKVLENFLCIVEFLF